MSALPQLPGFNFADLSAQRFNLSQTFKICNGYKLPKNNADHSSVAKSVKFATHTDTAVGFDASLIYGRCKTPSLPLYRPHFVLYDKKCLSFKAFFKQSVHDSPNEHYRIRVVNIIYFLEDDTITVIEPRITNSGLDQGRLVRRGKIPKTSSGTYLHWKDLAVGKNIAINGIVYHLVDCDGFTREYMLSQGLIMKEAEQIPDDPYWENRKIMHPLTGSSQISSADDKLGRFLKYNGKILKFDALWDDRDSEFGELQRCEVYYFLEDDTVTVKEIVGKRKGKEYPLLIKRIKLPKVWYDRPSDFPAAYLENHEYKELYQPKDFLVGETIFVLGRKILLIDCDAFTRNYFKSMHCIVQKPALVIDDETKKVETPKKMPPHVGFGSLEDSLQNTKSLIPSRPKQDVIRKIFNANKYLSYEMVMCDIHPEDSIRRFILQYSLADSTCRIYEPSIRNSGFVGGRFLRNTLITKPDSGDPLNPDYYSPNDFCIGATITIFGHRFKITGADLRVYRYMQANPEKFACETIENLRNYMLMKGFLEEDIREEFERLEEKEKQEKIDTMVEESSIEKTELQECLEKFQMDKKDDEEQHIADKSVITEKKDIPYGIKEVNFECPYPPIVKGKDIECKTEEEKQKASEFDTPENKLKKYYDGILRQQRALCAEKPQKSVTFAT